MVNEPASNVDSPVDGPLTSDQETIERLQAEIDDLKAQGSKETVDAPQPTVTTVAPEEVNETPDAPQGNGRPLLAESVNQNGDPTYPTNEDGSPNMREPGIHQSPVYHVHLDSGEVVQIMGAVPSYIHDAETGLHKVIAAFPVLLDEGKQALAGIFKGI